MTGLGMEKHDQCIAGEAGLAHDVRLPDSAGGERAGTISPSGPDHGAVRHDLRQAVQEPTHATCSRRTPISIRSFEMAFERI